MPFCESGAAETEGSYFYTNTIIYHKHVWNVRKVWKIWYRPSLIATVLDEMLERVRYHCQLLWRKLSVYTVLHHSCYGFWMKWRPRSCLTATSGERTIFIVSLSCTDPFPLAPFLTLRWIINPGTSLDTGQLFYRDNWPDAGQEPGVKAIIEFSHWTCHCWLIDWPVCKHTSWQFRYFISTGNILIKCSSLRISFFPQTWMSRVRIFQQPLPHVEEFQSTWQNSQIIFFSQKEEDRSGRFGRTTVPSHCCLALMWSIKIIEVFWSGTFWPYHPEFLC